MSDEQYLNYFRHLQGRSRLGWIYRKFYLYPRISHHLSGRVLDVGCGIGDFLNYHKNAVGLDVNPYTVKYCNEQGNEAYLMSEGKYPFTDGTFDSAVLDNVLEHLESPQQVLSEVRRILRPSGNLVVGVPGIKGFAADHDHNQFYSEKTLIDVVGVAGFQCVKTFYMPFRSSWLDTHSSQYCLYGIFECS